MKKKLFVLFFGVVSLVFAQDGIPFAEEVTEIVKRNDTLWNPNIETIVFTGSSSIRKWTDVQLRFPDHQVLNSGFGGSQAYNLLYFLDSLVLRYKPKQIFIYEGDNDIFEKKRPKEIISTIELIINKIKLVQPNAEIVLISTKPSISRWRLRGKYRRLNRKLESLTLTDRKLFYANVWDIMLDGRKVKKDIFIEDGLHMNAKGYELWYQIIKNYIK